MLNTNMTTFFQRGSWRQCNALSSVLARYFVLSCRVRLYNSLPNYLFTRLGLTLALAERRKELRTNVVHLPIS